MQAYGLTSCPNDFKVLGEGGKLATDQNFVRVGMSPVHSPYGCLRKFLVGPRFAWVHLSFNSTRIFPIKGVKLVRNVQLVSTEAAA